VKKFVHFSGLSASSEDCDPFARATVKPFPDSTPYPTPARFTMPGLNSILPNRDGPIGLGRHANSKEAAGMYSQDIP
jgi:hypothetical protein